MPCGPKPYKRDVFLLPQLILAPAAESLTARREASPHSRFKLIGHLMLRTAIHDFGFMVLGFGGIESLRFQAQASHWKPERPSFIKG